MEERLELIALIREVRHHEARHHGDQKWLDVDLEDEVLGRPRVDDSGQFEDPDAEPEDDGDLDEPVPPLGEHPPEAFAGDVPEHQSDGDVDQDDGQ